MQENFHAIDLQEVWIYSYGEYIFVGNGFKLNCIIIYKNSLCKFQKFDYIFQQAGVFPDHQNIIIM